MNWKLRPLLDCCEFLTSTTREKNVCSKALCESCYASFKWQRSDNWYQASEGGGISPASRVTFVQSAGKRGSANWHSCNNNRPLALNLVNSLQQQKPARTSGSSTRAESVRHGRSRCGFDSLLRGDDVHLSRRKRFSLLRTPPGRRNLTMFYIPFFRLVGGLWAERFGIHPIGSGILNLEKDSVQVLRVSYFGVRSRTCRFLWFFRAGAQTKEVCW